ncbi:MAG: lipid IV(A) 3-deoxy-D-manno-octulosonic acid transferase [Burkholderiales bacterium]
MPRIAYSLLLYLALPYVLLRLWWRSRRQPEYLQHVGERFGRYADAPMTAPLIWLHAVSVGETRAAEPLVRALRAKYPDHRILLTHMTPTGREAGVALFGDDVIRHYLPYDYPGAVRRFLDHFRPRVGLLMETEIWPNLVHACKSRGVPLHLVNARLSEKSFANYQRMSALTAATLDELTSVAAQTAADAQRFTTLGARNVSVFGNLKFDVDPPAELISEGARLRASIGARSVLLAASTREGEEGLLVENKLHAIPDVPHLLLVIVPRHPQRFDEVAALLEKHGVRYQRRSENTKTRAAIRADTQVLLGDSMGEMFAYYAACDVAFIGGSLLPFGGQNLIEACAVGKPVLVGPHTYNFADAAESAITAGAALRVMDTADLARKASALLTHPALMQRMGDAAIQFSKTHRGVARKLVDTLRF